MKRGFRRRMLMAFVVGGSGLLCLAPARLAMADAGYCSGGNNGFYDISDSAEGTIVRELDAGAGDVVTLETTLIRNWLGSLISVGYAKLSGATVNGEEVWMDVSTDGGFTWNQCGPFQVDHGRGTSKTSAAKPLVADPQTKFRACSHAFGAPITCTGWY
jgi:hypothetical protein